MKMGMNMPEPDEADDLELERLIVELEYDVEMSTAMLQRCYAEKRLRKQEKKAGLVRVQQPAKATDPSSVH